jgi:transcriptional regulator with XRE-family HTH domain
MLIITVKNPVAPLKAALENETLARDEVRRQLRHVTQHMSQRALASQLGISQSAIAQRLRGYQSDYDGRPLETLQSTAGQLQRSMASTDEALSSRLRLVAQAISDFRSLRFAHDQRQFLREPDSTGDSRWDALLAGVAARETRQAGLTIPRWTTHPERLCERPWFPTETPSLRAMAFAASPADFAIRNVYLDPAELESI